MSSCQLHQCDNHVSDKQLLPNNLVKSMVGRIQSIHSESDVVSGVNPPVKKKAPATASHGSSESKLSDDRGATGTISRGDAALDGRVPPVPTPRRKTVEAMLSSWTGMSTSGGDSGQRMASKSVDEGSYKIAKCDSGSESQPPVNKKDFIANEGFKSQLQQLLVTQANTKLDSASVTWKPKPPNKMKHLSSGFFLPLPPKPVLKETIHPTSLSKNLDNSDILPSKVHSSLPADGKTDSLEVSCQPPKVSIAGCFGTDYINVPNELSGRFISLRLHQFVL